MAQKNQDLSLYLGIVAIATMIGGMMWLILKPPTAIVDNKIAKTQDNKEQPVVSNQTETTTPKTFAEVENVPSGIFSYGGSTTWAPIRQKVDTVIENTLPQFQLRYTDPTVGTPGSGTGIRMLLQDQLTFSQSSRSLKQEEYQQASERDISLKEIPVAIDGIAIATHPELKLDGITLTQLKDIYTGKITNWKEIGGPDLAIVPYSRHPEDGGTPEFFVEEILQKETLGKNVQLVFDTTTGLRKLSQNPGGIYYASAQQIVSQCTVKAIAVGRKEGKWVAPYQEPFVPLSQCPQKRNQLNQDVFQSGEYPITRYLFVIVKQNGQGDEQAGMTYARLLLSDRGQELVSEAGFVRIR
jgi:phosphate transport system substrate-binding protein